MTALATAIIILLSISIWYFSALPRNYILACKTGLPPYLSPVSPNNPVWLVIFSVVGYPAMESILPRFLFDRVKLTMMGWEFHDRYEVNRRWGDKFILVTPGVNVVFVADPEVAQEVLGRRKEFQRLDVAGQIISVFGPNVFSAENEEWQRHRRIVVPALNERIMKTVWDESTTQTAEMLDSFNRTAQKPHGPGGIIEGLKRITIDVIGYITFGTQQSWKEVDHTHAPEGFKTTFSSSVLTIVNNLFPVVFLPAKLLTLPIMPKAVQKIGTAKIEFPLHLRGKIIRERSSPSSTATLVTSLVKLAAQSHPTNVSKSSTFLSEEEIAGNLFAFTVAGFDTTANTLVYALLALAIWPEWQEWVFEEMAERGSDFSYEELFPRLVRCRALMFETLRLHTPVPHVDRITSSQQSINEIHIPAQTIIQVSGACIHVDPSIWGSDALAFNPRRWVTSSRSSPQSVGQETLREPARGTFLPWSSGPRSCPGMKMAQVEFVAVVREICSNYRVEAARLMGETEKDARERLKVIVKDSEQKVTMQIRRPREVVLRFLKR